MSFNLLTLIGGLAFQSILNYMLCYYVTTITINVMSIGDKIYDLRWYQLSHSEQYIVRMLIRRSQKPFELKGLGVFVCSLETFVLVIIRICHAFLFGSVINVFCFFFTADVAKCCILLYDIPPNRKWNLISRPNKQPTCTYFRT